MPLASQDRTIARRRTAFNLEFAAQFRLRSEMEQFQDPDSVVDTVKCCLRMAPRCPEWWRMRVRWFHRLVRRLRSWMLRQRAQRERLIGTVCEFWEAEVCDLATFEGRMLCNCFGNL